MADYQCIECDTQYQKWTGRCQVCGNWNSIEKIAETPTRATPAKSSKARSSSAKTLRSSDPAEIESLHSINETEQRLVTGISEFDRVTGGGIVKGSCVLIGGAPGIGKSTMLLQIAASLDDAGRKVLYVTGEESVNQIRMRAQRMRLGEKSIGIATESCVERIIATLNQDPEIDLVVIDSIQTMWLAEIESVPGSVTQVRASAHSLTEYTKSRDMALILIGHVTKDGQLAGPRVLEHLVDVVLQFDIESNQNFRILRGLKNRYGSTSEIGLFQMQSRGLVEITNPSGRFLSERDEQSSGVSIFSGSESSRPILVEIQALVAESSFGNARRAVVGWDSNRLAMILAVLQARCGLSFGDRDVYLTVAGGFKISEPAADLAVAMALVSALRDVVLAPDTVYFGEIALSGSLRSVGQTVDRLKEASRLGFKMACMPSSKEKYQGKMSIKTFKSLSEAIDHI